MGADSGNKAAPPGRARPQNSNQKPRPQFTAIPVIAAAALGNASAVLARWLPDGKREGAEYCARNPTRNDARPGSFKVNTNSGKWSDFATGDSGGDLVALVAYLDGSTQGEAANSLAAMLGMQNNAGPAGPAGPMRSDAVSRAGSSVKEPGPAPEPERGPSGPNTGPILPIPPQLTADTEHLAQFAHGKHGSPSRVWSYRDERGHCLGYVCRFELAEGRKAILPRTAWPGSSGPRLEWKSWPAPRPLYGLDRLAAAPDALVLVCEGEKAADAAAILLPDAVCITSPGGAKAASKADWSVLGSRRVLIWKDADPAGERYARDVARLALEAGAVSVHWLRVAALRADPPEGWDAADALAEGATAVQLAGVLADRASNWLDLTDNVVVQATDRGATQSLAQDAQSKARFELNARGVWWHGCDSGGAEKPPEWVCSPLKIAALTRSLKNEDWGALLEWQDRDKRAHWWAMPIALLAGDGTEFRAELMRRGLVISSARSARNLLGQYVQQARPKARAKCVERTGWHGGAYVLPDRTIGDSDGERTIYQTEGAFDDGLAMSGTLDGWRSRVAALCRGNSRALFALSAALAGPLLHFVGGDGGGFHFRGNSSSGKSSVLHVAASVMGLPEICVRKWRATTNGLEGVAAQHCDAPLILDELSQMDPREAGEAAYLLANGSGKQRAQRYGHARGVKRWRVLLLSAGEISLAQHMAEGGKRARAGQEARLADLPADAGKGLGCFEDLHGRSSGAALADEFKAATAQEHGTAWPVWLKILVQYREALPKVLALTMREFIDKALPKDAEGQAQRVAQRFALVAAAGEFATGRGLTGWRPGEASDGVRACFDAWLRERGGAGDTEQRRLLANVRAFFEQHGESRFSDLDSNSDRPTINRAGFRRIEAGRLQYLVLPETFREELCKGHDSKQAVKWLRLADALLEGDGGHDTGRVRVEGQRHRVYVIDAEKLGDA